MPRDERVLLILLVAAYLVVGSLFAIRTPAWQAPDEPAHYNYAAQVAANGCCPLLETGDWDSAYLDTLKGAHFRSDTLGALASVQYEDHQPPLYYLLASALFRLTSGSLIALRLLSVVIGAGVVFGAYAVGKALLPAQPQIALGVAALVAFLPQHAAMLAAVNNDGLAELIVAVTLWLTVRYLKSDRVPAWLLGVLVGVGLLTKVSTIFLAGLVPLAIVMKWWLARREANPARSPALLRDLVLFALPALVLTGVWWARNASVYGFPDVFGLARHDQVVVGQLRTADYIAELGVGEYLRRGVETTYNSFWGQFGWMALPLQAWTYTLILVALALAALGWLIAQFVRPLSRDSTVLPVVQRAAWAILIVTAALALAQYIYYNTEFVQFQGRYLYPGLIPFGLGLALGVDGWRRLLFRERAALLWLTPAVIALLLLLDLYVVWRVLPGLAS